MKIIYYQFIIYIFSIYSFLFQLGKKKEKKERARNLFLRSKWKNILHELSNLGFN